ncbi:DUF2383 domain-containing protein [Paraliobacillus sediminis]|uniref:DUF2383 domain-containing protein n=1 Tax=Paraliobacillus sediminis TaxID=1885916 RepID=UPI000E3CD797|nr:DUF2383 domain-containing protein [Paraliobacillus sediminis]
MQNEIVIEELNTILRGSYMGVRSIEHYIQKINDDKLKQDFQFIQQEVKQDAQKLAERIQNLGGVPANSEGITGSMHSFVHKAMLSDEPNKIIEDAIKGIDNYGVEYSEEIVKGDLDPESKKIINEVIDGNRKHVEHLRGLLH